MEPPFETLGESGFTDLASAFYRRLKGDEVVGRFYPNRPEAFRHAEQQLAGFLINRFGGSGKEWEGTPLGLRHSWMNIGRRERDRWLELMSAAMDEIGVEGAARLRLDQFFADTANALLNSDEPEEIPPSPYKRERGHPFEGIPDVEL